MDIIRIEEKAIEQIPFIYALGNGNKIYRKLPILEAEVESLPEGLEAIIATGDLQGVDIDNGQLLGHTVARVLESLADRGTIPAKQKIGIILAGDLWATANKRGGVGDVRAVWQAMASRFCWVAGVGGNHDCFGKSPQEMKAFRSRRGIYYFDGNLEEVNGLRLAGVSGIIGKPTKHFRRRERDFLKLIQKLVKKSPDVLILHEGPGDRARKLMGRESIRQVLINTKNLVTICGHSHWKIPKIELPLGSTVVNVDGRAIVFRVKSKE